MQKPTDRRAKPSKQIQQPSSKQHGWLPKPDDVHQSRCMLQAAGKHTRTAAARLTRSRDSSPNHFCKACPKQNQDRSPQHQPWVLTPVCWPNRQQPCTAATGCDMEPETRLPSEKAQPPTTATRALNIPQACNSNSSKTHDQIGSNDPTLNLAAPSIEPHAIAQGELPRGALYVPSAMPPGADSSSEAHISCISCPAQGDHGSVTQPQS